MYKHYLPLILCINLYGCATIFNSNPQYIDAKAMRGETGVEVEITSPSGIYTDELPTKITAESDNEGVKIRVTDKEYRDAVSIVRKNVTPSYFLNIFFWPGFLIDWATGKMWKYSPTIFVSTNKNS